jgi:hypothetical protein
MRQAVLNFLAVVNTEAALAWGILTLVFLNREMINTRWIKDRAIQVWATTKHGYDESYWIFFTLGGGAVLSSYFGWAGAFGAGLTLACFYVIGRVHSEVVKPNPQVNA